MWSSLSSYADVSGLKAAASKLKGQLSELTSEVLADLEESESQAKDNVEQFRARKAAEQQQMHGQHAGEENGVEQELPAGSERFQHQQPNGYDAPTSSSQNGFFDAAAHALQAQLEDEVAPVHSIPLSDGVGLGHSSFPVSDLDDTQRAEQAAYEQHLREQRLLQEQHMHQQQQQQINGFGQTHDSSSFDHSSLHSHALMPLDTMASPQYDGSPAAAPHSAHAFHPDHTPVAHVHTLHQATHSPSQVHEHALEEHGGLSIEHTAPVESDSQSPLNLSHASRDHSHADEMDGVDLQQQHQQAMFDHAHQQLHPQQPPQAHDQQQLAHLQSLLQQSEFDHAQQSQQAAARIQQLEVERQERDDQLAQMQLQAQESRARLSAELESKEQEYERLQSAYTQLMQRQEAATATAAAPVMTQPSSSAVDSESSLDVTALLDDSSVPADEKLSLLAEEIELLTARSRKWQSLAQATAASDARPAVAASPVPTPAAVAPSSASADADAARIAALESQVEELQERLESVTDEKDTLTEILNELKAESNQAAAPAAAAAESDARWTSQVDELQSQLRALTAEKERMSHECEQSNQSHAAQLHHLEEQLSHAHQQISAAQTTAADQQQAMLETLQLQQKQTEEIKQLQQQVIRANQEIAALNDQHEADQTALHQLQLQQQQELQQLSASHDAALLAASASVPSSPSNRSLLPAFDISASSSVANTPAGTGAQLLPPTTPSPSLERAQELESLRAQLADLTKSNEKLRHFRGQAVAWKAAAEASMHKLLARKEQIQRELKQVTMERDAMRQQQGLTMPASGDGTSASSSSPSGAEASSLPFADPARVAELQAHEHAAALALVQAQLDLARQQLGMQLDQIEALQGRIRELETQGRQAAHAQASSPAHVSSAEDARIQHEYLQVTDALRTQLQTAEQTLEAQRSQLDAAAAQEQQLHSIQQQHHELQTNYTSLLEAYESVCNRGRQDAAAAAELQQQLQALQSKSQEELSALQLQLDAARNGSSADVASLQSEWAARLTETEERFSSELQQARDERAKSESSWLEMLTAKQEEWNLEVEQERQAWKLTEQQWAAQQQAAAEQTAQQIKEMQDELQSSNQQIQSLQQQLQAAVSAAPAAASPVSSDSSARVKELEAEVAALTEKAAQTADFTRQMVAQMNGRYEQLLNSFTNLQARCRDGLEGEEGNLAQIAELRAALATQQKAAAEMQNDLQTQLDAARAESRKAAAGSGELGIMTMRWREAMSEADSLRKKIRSLQEDRGEPISGGDSAAAPSAELQDELHALRHQVKNLQLDAASMESLQSDYAALQRNFDMSASMLTEARTTCDELRRALDDAQRAEHAAQSELASLRNASADSLAVQASSSLDSASSQVAELQSALSRKSEQLSEMSQYTSTLEAEIMSLRRTFESKLKNFNALADEHLVDRRLVVKMLVTYFERPNKDEVLSLMGRVLQFTAEDNARIQKGRQGYMGMLGSFLRSPGGSEEESAPFHSEADANLADNFFNFLMQETEKEAAAAAAAAGGAKTAAVAPAPLTTSSAARAALDHQRQTASFSRESEFESRPTRSFAEQQPQHTMPQQTATQQQTQQQPQQQHPQWSLPPALAPSPLPLPPMNGGGAGAHTAPPSFAPMPLPPFPAAHPPFPPAGAPAGFVSLPPLPFAVPPHAMAPFPGTQTDASVAPPGFLMPPQPLGPLPPMPVNGFQLPPPLHAPH